MFDAWYLKLAQTWDRLTTSEAAKASDTRYRASEAKMTAEKEQKRSREEKPSDEGLPTGG